MNSATHTPTGQSRFVVSTLRCASYFFLLLGVAAAGYAGYTAGDAQVYQRVELRKFDRVAPLTEPRLLTLGEVFGEIEIPNLALKAVVVEGDSPAVLRRAVGHLPETAMPGEWGNLALAGHRDTFFRPLRHVRPGDLITLRSLRGERFQYRVESTSVVSPTDIEVLKPANGRKLTLITCFPFDYVGAAPNRFIIRAVEVPPTKD
jgi:sortase A